MTPKLSNEEKVGMWKSSALRPSDIIKPTPPPLPPTRGLCLKVYPGGVISARLASVSIGLSQVSVRANTSIDFDIMVSVRGADFNLTDLALSVARLILLATGPGFKATSPASKSRMESFNDGFDLGMGNNLRSKRMCERRRSAAAAGEILKHIELFATPC